MPGWAVLFNKHSRTFLSVKLQVFAGTSLPSPSSAQLQTVFYCSSNFATFLLLFAISIALRNLTKIVTSILRRFQKKFSKKFRSHLVLDSRSHNQ